MNASARFALAVSLLALTCAACTSGARQAESRERIQALQQQWVDAVARGDVETIVGFYAEDAWFLPAGSPPLQGHEQIRAWWEKTLADPPWQSLTFGPTRIAFSDDGRMAYDVGASRTTLKKPDGEAVKEGKYLIVWRRIDGDWKVVADAFNDN